VGESLGGGEAKPPPPPRYLKARGLSLEPPPTLRVAFLKGEPVMVARVEGKGGLLGLHLTILEPDGRKRKEKRLAKGSKPKGGAIRLFPLEAGNPWPWPKGLRPRWPCGRPRGGRCGPWSPPRSFLKVASLPPEVKEVVVAADHDKAGLEAARALARRLLREGRRVRLAVPPVEGEDWLDALKRLGPEEVGRLLQGAPEVEASLDLVQTEGFRAKAFAQNQPAPGRYSAYFVQRYIHDGREANPWEEKGGGPWR
jgi:putative DNA primase/helicase